MRIKNVKGRGAYIRTNINVFIYTFLYKSVATDVHAYNLTCLHTHKQTCTHTFIHIRIQKKHSRTYRETRTVTTQSDMFINTSTHPHTHPYVFFYFSYSVFYFVHHFSCFILQTPSVICALSPPTQIRSLCSPPAFHPVLDTRS